MQSKSDPDLSHCKKKKSDEFPLEDITKEVQKLEHEMLYHPKMLPPSDSHHEQVLRAHQHIIKLCVFSSVFKWVPEQYYSFPLSRRAEILGAHSTHQLCKSMLMENKAFASNMKNSAVDTTYSPFYLVVLQYESVITTKQLESEIRALRPVTARLDTSKFDFRLASEEDNARITGYTHNAVTPFGLLEKVPVIFAKAIVDNIDMTQFIWMGGGHVHLKVGMAVKDFIHCQKPMVLDVTNPRNNTCGIDE